MTTPRCDVDARIGGKYRVEMHSPTGSVHIVTGEFKEIQTARTAGLHLGVAQGRGPHGGKPGDDHAAGKGRRRRSDPRTCRPRQRRHQSRSRQGLDLELDLPRRRARRTSEVGRAGPDRRRPRPLVERAERSHRLRGEGRRLPARAGPPPFAARRSPSTRLERFPHSVAATSRSMRARRSCATSTGHSTVRR